jgi:hypothetical protein
MVELMDTAINRFIKHTIANLEGALEKDEPQLTWAVLKNLSSVIESYVEAIEHELELV